MANSFEHDGDPSGAVTGMEFLASLTTGFSASFPLRARAIDLDIPWSVSVIQHQFRSL
jgi:hypothetical protein